MGRDFSTLFQEDIRGFNLDTEKKKQRFEPNENDFQGISYL